MSKSRGERGKTPAQIPQTMVQISNDIVPGRFTESDWNHMLDEETEEDFVFDILQEVVATALDQIYYKIVEQRVIPFTVNAAKDLLLEVVEWQFLVRDPGESGVNENKTWFEDEEPAPPITDSWAQGIIPVVQMEKFPISDCIEQEFELSEANSSVELKHVDEDFSRALQPSPNSMVDEPYTQELAQTESTTSENDSNDSSVNMQQPEPPSKPKLNTSKTFKTYRGKIPSFQPISTTPITDDQSRLKQQQSLNETGAVATSSGSNIQSHFGKTFESRDFMYDQKGNIISMQKLNMDTLPSHRVKIKFAVVDPLEEEFKAKLANNKQRYSLHKNGSADKRANAACVVIDNTCSRENESKLVSPLPPPLVDTINVAPGVVIKEKGVIKRGIRQPLNQYQSLGPLGSSFKTMEDGAQKDSASVVPRLNRSRPLPAIGTRE